MAETPTWDETSPIVETQQAAPTWDETSEVVEAPPKWEDTKEVEKTGATEAVIRGAAQGLTFGFADEITAAAESVFTDKTYDQSLKESRQAYNKAKEDQTTAYNVGDYGATAASLLIPGGLGVKAGAKAAQVGAKAGAKLGSKITAKNIAKATSATSTSPLRIGSAIMSGGKSEIARLGAGAALKTKMGKKIAKEIVKNAAKVGKKVGKSAGEVTGRVGTAALNIPGRVE